MIPPSTMINSTITIESMTIPTIAPTDKLEGEGVVVGWGVVVWGVVVGGGVIVGGGVVVGGGIVGESSVSDGWHW